MRTTNALLLAAVALAGASCGSSNPPTAVAASPRGPVATTPPLTPSPTRTSIQIPPIPEGTYGTDVSAADAKRFGMEESRIPENTGHFTLTLRAGRWKLKQTAGHPINQPVIEGVYSGTARMVVFEWQFPATETGTTTCRWRFEKESKQLFLTVLQSDPDPGTSVDAATATIGDRTVFQSHPWRKTR